MHLIRRFLFAAFGQFSWQPPAWLRRRVERLAAWTAAHPRLGPALFALLLTLGLASSETWRWYQRRPQPVTVSVQAEPPGLPALDAKVPRPLIVRFGASVAPLEDLQSPNSPREKLLPAGVRLEPPVAGAWHWESEDRLVFQPKSDWPAARTYRIHLEPTLVARHVLLARYQLEVKTPDFTAAMPKLEFYTDPTEPAVKQVTATLEFSHAVDPAAVQQHVELSLIGGSEIFPSGRPRFTLTAGPKQRVIYLRTSALTLPEKEDFLRVALDEKLTTTQGGAPLAAAVEKKVVIPDRYSFFKIASAECHVVDNKDGEPEQILFLRTRGACRSDELQHALHVFLLPKKHPDKDEDADAKWQSAREVDEAVLKRALVVPLQLVPAAEENSELHSFRIALENPGQLYVTVDKGAKALGGFLLRAKYEAITVVPEYPRAIEIQGKGGILALQGERKLSIRSRGVETIQYEIGRVPAAQINHLVSQTRGEFQDPEFVNYHFGRENLARIATERQAIKVQSRAKPNYSTFDFSKHLQPADETGAPLHGLFFLRAREWREEDEAEPESTARQVVHDPANRDDDESDLLERNREPRSDEDGPDDRAAASRFVLVTDLGLVVKENTDRTRDVFVASIKTGDPLGGVTVEVLAKNGLPLYSGRTAPDGRVTIPSLGLPEREKLPVAFIARLGTDLAFMPFARHDRVLDFSRFEIGGVQSLHGTDLDGFLFTERGIYRPGDEIHLALIVKQRDWAGDLEGLPVKMVVRDARGDVAQERRLALPKSGFLETNYQTAYESPTGTWLLSAYLVTEGEEDVLLAQTSVNVKEFLPDRMKIESHLSREAKTGWITPGPLHAEIELKNLYGTPASDRVVQGKLALSPAGFYFDEYPGFEFRDPLRDPKKEVKEQSVELGDTKTDESGGAGFELELERFQDATYAMTFHAEGFEAESGRSVGTSNRVLVSPLPWVIGAKRDGDFAYVPMGSQRAVQWLALNPALEKIALEGLECRLVEHTWVSVLGKNEEGNYAYESVAREGTLRAEPLALPAAGLAYPLPTDVPGKYSLELWDKESGRCVSSVTFTIVGRGAVGRSLEKNAELQVTLSRPQYDTGDEIEIGIVAPYTGSGLITLERDKVYAHAWFKADRTSTVQHIRVPADFEGTGYVSVCFIRGLDSKEVFMSPLSYAAVPFQANVEKRRLPITLHVPPRAKPGEGLHISYQTDRPARIAIFAVDKGILQVTDYETPDPLGRFFRKSALLVQTRQLVDLILPEFSLLRGAAAFGGDSEKHLNPFRRLTEKPVVYWSGLLDAGPRAQEVVYEVPDYFSGTLSVMAVAVAPDAVGSAGLEPLVRGPFVLTPNVPTVAAPGDQFEVSVTVANGVEGSGEKAAVQVQAQPSEGLEIVQAPAGPLTIAEGREASAIFTVRAKAKFGGANLVFRAAAAGQETAIRSTLSVRPAVPFQTSVQSVRFTGGSAEVKPARTLAPEFRRQELTISAVPLGLARGLDAYLHNYPNGCSEQITSGAFARLALADEADFGLSREEVSAQMEHTFAVLARRQNDQGGFGYWVADRTDGIDFISVYVMHFLLEAKEAGFAPPPALIENGLKHLQQIATHEPHSLREARTQAQAIYLLTRAGVITTNYALNLREYLDRTLPKQWQSDLTAAYLAGTWALLQRSEEAVELSKGYVLGRSAEHEWWDFHTQLGADAQYVSLLARHFPAELRRLRPEDFEKLTRPISEGRFSTLSAAYAVLALKSYSHAVAQNPPALGAVELAGKSETALRLEGGGVLRRGGFSPQAQSVRFTAKGALPRLGVFAQLVQAGYDQQLPTVPVREGLEIYRELLDARGLPTETVRLGEPVTVRLRLRSLRNEPITNVAIVDLLPGGFEFAPDGLKAGAGALGFDYVETREDRAVFFGTIDTRVRTVEYTIKATNRGHYVLPPAFAESMYDRTITARALPGRINVVDAP